MMWSVVFLLLFGSLGVIVLSSVAAAGNQVTTSLPCLLLTFALHVEMPLHLNFNMTPQSVRSQANTLHIEPLWFNVCSLVASACFDSFELVQLLLFERCSGSMLIAWRVVGQLICFVDFGLHV